MTYHMTYESGMKEKVTNVQLWLWYFKVIWVNGVKITYILFYISIKINNNVNDFPPNFMTVNQTVLPYNGNISLWYNR